MSSPLVQPFRRSLEHFFKRGDQKETPSPQEILRARGEFLSKIHPSWYEEKFAALSPLERRLLGSSLPPPLQEKLGLKGRYYPALFQETLLTYMGLDGEPPLLLLDKGPFAPLFEMQKEQLVELISLLPFPLLAPQLKRVLDKRRLLSLYSLFTPGQRELLQFPLFKPSPGDLKEVDLTTWSGSAEGLRHELHRTGLELLSEALAGAGETLRFYLSRILDRGRGKIFLKGPSEPICKEPKALLLVTLKFFSKERSS